MESWMRITSFHDGGEFKKYSEIEDLEKLEHDQCSPRTTSTAL